MPVREREPTEGLPPGPDLTRERQTARFAMRPLAFLEELRAEFGDVFTVHALDESPWVMVSDPDLIAGLFRAPADVLHAGEAKRGVLAPLLGDNSLLLLDEERHTEQRALMRSSFRQQMDESYATRMRTIAERALKSWPLGEEQPATRLTRAIALEVILATVFGMTGGERLAYLREALRELRLPGNSRESHTPAFRRTVAHLDGLIFAEIAERKAAGPDDRQDVLSQLLAARCEDGSSMSSVEIRDELMTLLVAGYETTATTLAWALELLARNPEVLARVEADIEGGNGHYTEAAIRETMRLRPALPTIARTVKQPFELGTHLLPPGAMIRVAVLLVHHRADLYPEPRAFRPERFYGKPPDARTWLPFGGGARRCIGAGFSLIEARVVLATLLEHATVRAVGAEPEQMRHRDITLTPSRGARLVLESR